MSLCYPKQEDKQFLEELKDQPTPTPSDEEELAERLNILNQATSSSGGKSSENRMSNEQVFSVSSQSYPSPVISLL